MASWPPAIQRVHRKLRKCVTCVWIGVLNSCKHHYESDTGCLCGQVHEYERFTPLMVESRGLGEGLPGRPAGRLRGGLLQEGHLRASSSSSKQALARGGPAAAVLIME